eukprot:15341368-Ditylum_brightwellii.AAC.1
MMEPISNLISLPIRRPLHFTSEKAPWNIHKMENITIIPAILELDESKDNKQRKEIAEKAIEQQGTFHMAYWTDASVLATGQGSSACATALKKFPNNPYKYQNLQK